MENLDLDYREEEAIKFISNSLPANMKMLVKEEDIEYVLDFIFDFYNEKGYLDDENEESDESVEIIENEMFNYIMEKIEEDGKSNKFPENVVAAIMEGEFEYCKSVGVFE
jgi:hypothetical protein